MENGLCAMQPRQLLINNSKERRHDKGTVVLKGTAFIEPYRKSKGSYGLGLRQNCQSLSCRNSSEEIGNTRMVSEKIIKSKLQMSP